MKLRLISAILVFAPLAAALDPCMPVVNNPVTVDGIVVGADIGGVGTPPGGCSADKGWAGVLAQTVPVVLGTPGTKTANMFLAAHRGGGDNMDKIYLGLHIENAPDFTTNDKLTIYFHANGASGDWDTAKDFALVFDGVGPAAATPSDDGCLKDPGGQVRYYMRDAGNSSWVPQGSVPAGITFKTSYDFEQVHDPEWQLWELEIGIDVSTLGISNAAQIGIGAKLYLYEAGVNATTVYHYPSTLTPIADSGLDFLPNAGSVTPATLQKVTVGSCSLDVIITAFKSTSNKGNANEFTVLTPADFDTAGNALKHNHFSADVKFVNPANLADTSSIAVANSGNVKFDIMPWNNGFIGDFTMNTLTESFTAVGQTLTPKFDWPLNKAQWDATGGKLNGPGHACLKIDLSGFTVDLPNGNQVQQNLAYTSLSTIQESFLLQAPRELRGVYNKEPYIEYVLRARWDNIDRKYLRGKRAFKFRFTNAHAIRLKKIGKDYYALRLKRGQEVRVALEITGGVMPHPTQEYKISPKAGEGPGADQPLQIAVKPGSVVNIVAKGLITIGGGAVGAVAVHAPNDANGFALRDTPVTYRQQYLLPDGAYRANQHIGALIASCDDFHTAFVVGSDSTFAVPAACTSLSLAINSIVGSYGTNSGAGFDLTVVEGDPMFLPTRLGQRGSIPVPQFGLPAQMQPGSNLPQLVIDASQRFRRQLIPSGYVAYAITASHVK